MEVSVNVSTQIRMYIVIVVKDSIWNYDSYNQTHLYFDWKTILLYAFILQLVLEQDPSSLSP